MSELVPLNTSQLPVKLRLEDYLLLDDAGAFEAYRKTELIDGEIYFMNAQHRPHARIKSRLHILIAAALAQLAQGLEAIVEGSVAMPPNSSPEPDIVVTSEPNGDGLIPLGSVQLIVEVSDSTLAFDTKRKGGLYARNNVPEYWIVDIEAAIIHQMWAPDGDVYAQRRMVAFGERIEAITMPGLAIQTSLS